MAAERISRGSGAIKLNAQTIDASKMPLIVGYQC
jgi:hypothetical protein